MSCGRKTKEGKGNKVVKAEGESNEGGGRGGCVKDGMSDKKGEGEGDKDGKGNNTVLGMTGAVV